MVDASLEQQCVEALQRASLPVQRVRIDTTRLKGGYICGTMRIYPEYEGDSSQSLPPSMVLKMEDPESKDHDVALELKLYEREWHFYDVLSGICYEVVRCPHHYGTVQRRGGAKCGVIVRPPNLPPLRDSIATLRSERIHFLLTPPQMEDLQLLNHVSSGITRSILCPDLDHEGVLLTVEHIARLHAKFWCKDAELEEMGLKRLNSVWFKPSWRNRVERHLPHFCQKWRDYGVLESVQDTVAGVPGAWRGFGLTEEAIAAAERIVNGFQWVQDELSKSPSTLLHG
jgi:hypothetical protein